MAEQPNQRFVIPDPPVNPTLEETQQYETRLNQFADDVTATIRERQMGIRAMYHNLEQDANLANRINVLTEDARIRDAALANHINAFNVLTEDVRIRNEALVNQINDLANLIRVENTRLNLVALNVSRIGNIVDNNMKRPIEHVPSLDGNAPELHGLPLITSPQEIDELNRADCEEYLRFYGHHIGPFDDDAIRMKRVLSKIIGLMSFADSEYVYHPFQN